MRCVSSVMTGVPVMLREDDMLIAAARVMRDNAVGVVMVVRDGRLCGLVTDRDIVVRALAAGRRDAADIPVRDVCSSDPVTVGPDDDVGAAVRLMRERAVRRLPVVEDGHPVGMVSIGDLAAEQDGQSALAEISVAPPTF
jgi:CBS domain-containing protein